MQDKIIQEINEYFILQGFTKVSFVRSEVWKGYETNFMFKNGRYYVLTVGEKLAFLECAGSLEEAQKNMYEDVESYNLTADAEIIIVEIKKTIQECIINEPIAEETQAVLQQCTESRNLYKR